MRRMKFPAGFLWGAATAAYQIEGAFGEDGKGESVWDRFSSMPGRIIDGSTGETACDHYHRYMEDIRLMKELGLMSYRFSISWPRIYPYGKGIVNGKGLDFYKKLACELLANGIKPVATLYHWDLPQALQNNGGWANSDTSDYFAEYAACMYHELGDLVGMWITHNEPSAVSFAGHAFGEHAPGLKDFSLAVKVSQHLLLSHAKAVSAFRQTGIRDGKIGITLYLAPVYPASDLAEDRKTAKVFDGFLNRWYLDTVMKGSYPRSMVELYAEKLKGSFTPPEETELLKSSAVDFLGVNYYTRFVVRSSDKDAILGVEVVKPPEARYTGIGWEIYPPGLYDLLKRIHMDYHPAEIYITENGAAFHDNEIKDGRIIDDDRIEYLEQHFSEAWKAIQDGINLKGYYIWTLMDNFEWAYGFTQRFGLLRTDFGTGARSFKKSALWYRKIIDSNGFP